MKSAPLLCMLAAVASAVPTYQEAHHRGRKHFVTSEALQADITRGNLFAGAQKLQSFANASAGHNRLIGSQGHNDTIYWLKNELEALNYYDVSLQNFFVVAQTSGQINSFFVNGVNTTADLLEYSASGRVTAPLVVVANLGCNASDYPAEVSGKIALVSRGSCEFGLKSALAGSAGAAAVIVYNNVPGPFSGTLGTPPREEGDYVVSVIVSQDLGNSYVDSITGGANITATLDVTTVVQNISTYNVVATSRRGDQNNKLALGAHTDSVSAGPGINDDGSGTIGILEVAKALSKYKINNAVTFGFWAAEEEGLVGSTYYTEHLPAEEAAKIRAYLNFDMIASPNYVHAIYDGDGSAFNLSGPAGSGQLEDFFEDYFTNAGQNFTATEFNGRSDYGGFLDLNIPSGGTFTGAEELKTEEEAALFGGEAGVALDPCYHSACDTINNLNMDAFELHGKAIAAAVATYTTSWEGFPSRNTTLTRRHTARPRKSKQDRHYRNKRALAQKQ